MLGERARHLGHLPFSLEQLTDAARTNVAGNGRAAPRLAEHFAIGAFSGEGIGSVIVRRRRIRRRRGGRGLAILVAHGVCRVPGYEFPIDLPARNRQSRKSA